MSDAIVPSFPLMLLNAGQISWTPFHQWNDRCLLSYKISREACIGSLYYIPAHRQPRFHQPSPARADAKGRWVLLGETGEPLVFADLHRYNFGYQSDLLYVNFREASPDWQEALAVLVSGVLLSSDSDVLRVVLVNAPTLAADPALTLPAEWGKAVTLHHLSRRLKELAGAGTKGDESALELLAQPALEVLPQDWWGREPGKALRSQMGYIERLGKAERMNEAAKRKKPTPVRRKSLLRRLFFPFSKR